MVERRDSVLLVVAIVLFLVGLVSGRRVLG